MTKYKKRAGIYFTVECLPSLGDPQYEKKEGCDKIFCGKPYVVGINRYQYNPFGMQKSLLGHVNAFVLNEQFKEIIWRKMPINKTHYSFYF